MKSIKTITAGAVLSIAVLLAGCSSDSNVTYSHSAVDDDLNYTHSMTGITAQFDDNWTIASDTDLATQNGTSDFLEALEDNGYVVDLVAYFTDSGSNMNINVEDLGKLYGSILDESSYIDQTLPELESSLEEMGIGVTIDDVKKTQVLFAGKTCSAIKMTATYLGIEMEQECICLKSGNYMTCFTFTALESEDMELMKAYFKAA